MLVSVVIPAHDAAATLPETLAGLDEQRVDGDFEVIVVDDASSDATGELARRAGARVIRHERALGPGASRNVGAAAARGDALAFTDADCRPAPGWLAAGVAALSDAGLVQGRVEPVPGVPVGPFDRTLWVTGPWGLFESANLFVRREVFEGVGGFDDGLLALAGAHFGEDVIFGWRARRNGVRTAFCDNALVHHAVFPRDAAGFIWERRRNGLFAALAREVPELRDEFLYQRWFLSRRSAEASLAAAGIVAAAAARRPGLAALAAVPWGMSVMRDLRADGAPVALARAGADVLGLASTAWGSLRARTLVL